MSNTSKINEGSKVVRLGQLKLKRTIYEDPSVIRVYFPQSLYFKLCTIAHFMECTPDEAIREAITDFVNQCDNG